MRSQLWLFLHIHPPVTEQRQTLTIWRSAYFSLQFILRVWRNLHLLRSFQSSNVPVDFFSNVVHWIAACSKPQNRDTGNHRKVSYPRTQQRDHRVWVEPRLCNKLVLKEILLEIGFVEEMRTTWGNEEVPQTFSHNFPYSRKYLLIHLTL